MTPEARARQTIDALLTAAGWHICDMANANLRASTGVAIREFPLEAGHGFADYLLYVNGKACTASRKTTASAHPARPLPWCWAAAPTGASSGKTRRGGR